MLVVQSVPEVFEPALELAPVLALAPVLQEKHEVG